MTYKAEFETQYTEKQFENIFRNGGMYTTEHVAAIIGCDTATALKHLEWLETHRYSVRREYIDDGKSYLWKFFDFGHYPDSKLFVQKLTKYCQVDFVLPDDAKSVAVISLFREPQYTVFGVYYGRELEDILEHIYHQPITIISIENSIVDAETQAWCDEYLGDMVDWGVLYHPEE